MLAYFLMKIKRYPSTSGTKSEKNKLDLTRL